MNKLGSKQSVKSIMKNYFKETVQQFHVNCDYRRNVQYRQRINEIKW